jgi:cytochrome P450
VEHLRPQVAAIIDELIDETGEGEADLVERIALPLPIMVIGELLGIPRADREQCRVWTDRIGRVVDPVVTPDMRVAMNQALTEFSAYLAEQVQIRKNNPGPDLLSSLVTMEENGDRLTDDEIIANVLLLFNAEKPGLMSQAVEELSRYDSPVQIAARIMTADVALGDTTIPAAAKVMMIYGAANRDPARYTDPDRLNLRRTGVKSLAYGGGTHFCTGAPLARLEVGMVFTALLQRYQSIELATDQLSWRANFNLRGLAELPLRLSQLTGSPR